MDKEINWLSNCPYEKQFPLDRKAEIEWFNYWKEDAKIESDNKILLIGDSTSRFIRKILQEKVQMPVDLIATSANVADIEFAKQIDSYFSNVSNKYKFIVVQLGIHGIYGSYNDIGIFKEPNGNSFSFGKKDLDEFGRYISYLITFLLQFTSRILIESCYDSVNYGNKGKWVGRLSRLLKLKEDYNTDKNIIKHEKNYILEKIAKDFNLPFLDINQYMRKFDKTCKHVDEIHYTLPAYKKACDRMILKFKEEKML